MHPRYILTICYSLLLLASCMRPTTLDPQVEPEVIVNCVLEYPGEEQVLYLSYARAVDGSGGEGIISAQVTLQDDSSGEDAVGFRHWGSGGWILPSQVIPGHRYTLKVEISGQPIIEASTTVPQSYQVQHDVSGRYSIDSLGEETLWVYTPAERIMTDCTAVDPFNQSEASYHRKYLRIPSPGAYEPGWIQLYPNPEDISKVVFMVCSEDYDRYLKDVLSYQIRLLINDITTFYDPSNIYSNIRGGYGIFGARVNCEL